MNNPQHLLHKKTKSLTHSKHTASLYKDEYHNIAKYWPTLAARCEISTST